MEESESSAAPVENNQDVIQDTCQDQDHIDDGTATTLGGEQGQQSSKETGAESEDGQEEEMETDFILFANWNVDNPPDPGPQVPTYSLADFLMGEEDDNDSDLSLEDTFGSRPKGKPGQKSVPKKKKPCLICLLDDRKDVRFRQTKSSLKSKEQKINPVPSPLLGEVGENLSVIFVMKKILEVDSTEILKFMEESNGSNPKEWIHLCVPCRNLVNEFVTINDQIMRLEENMTKCKKQIYDKLRKSSRISGMVMQNYPREDIAVTKRVRELVRERIHPATENASFEYDDEFPSEDRDEDPDFTLEYSVGQAYQGATFHDDEDFFIEDEFPSRTKLVKTNRNSSLSRAKATVARARMHMHKNNHVIPKETRPMHIPKYTCPTCPQLEEMSFDAFLQHLIFHGNYSCKCTLCSMHLSPIIELVDRHWKDFHEDNPASSSMGQCIAVEFDPGKLWKCEKCDEKFSTFSERDEHERTVHQFVAEMVKSCFTCSSTNSFRSEDELRLHNALTHPEKATTDCCYCDQTFAATSVEGITYLDGEEMSKHVRETHRHKLQRNVSSRPRKRSRFVVTSPAVVLHHCPFCGEVFEEAQFTKLKEHLEKKHGVLDMGKLFTCPICHNAVTPLRLSKHLRTMHAPPMVCDTCGEEMKPDNLPLHMYTKHGILLDGEKILKCKAEGCDYATFNGRNLARHVTKHEFKPKSFTCQYCGKAFTSAHYLRNHESIHKNAETKPYKCDLCSSSFAVSTYLYMHKRMSHQGRPFPSTHRKRKAATVTPNSSGTYNRDDSDSNDNSVAGDKNIYRQALSSYSQSSMAHSSQMPLTSHGENKHLDYSNVESSGMPAPTAEVLQLAPPAFGNIVYRL